MPTPGFRYFIATSSDDGAIARHFRALARGLAQSGSPVLLLVHGSQLTMDEAEVAGLTVMRWPSPRPTRFQDARFLYHLIRQHRPDVLIGNFGAVNIMMIVGWLLRVPHRIAWYHTMSAATDFDNQMPRWKKSLLTWRKRVVYRLATRIVANSHAAARDVSETFSVPVDKLSVLYYSLPDPVTEYALSLAAPAAANKIVCVGRLYPTKGQDIFIRALAVLRDQFPDFCVEFVGDGPMKDAYIQLVDELGLRDQCVFVGAVSRELVFSYMQGATVCVVPSRSDAFGLVNIEAMAVGTPVVATRVGGFVEVIRDGIDGFIVPLEDPAAMAAKLKLILSDSSLRDSLSRSSRQRFLDMFERGAVIPREVEWFERLRSGAD